MYIYIYICLTLITSPKRFPLAERRSRRDGTEAGLSIVDLEASWDCSRRRPQYPLVNYQFAIENGH